MLRWCCILICALSLIVAPAFAQPGAAPTREMSVGSGPYAAAIVEGDSGLPDHTIYRPKDLSPFGKSNLMPVVAWGNGGCSSSSRMHANFLAEVASQGFLVLALGPYVAESDAGGGMGMGGGGGTKSAQMLEAIDWATTENKRSDSKYFGKLDPSKFAVAGMSCGGLQALEVAPDPRVKTLLVMDSGLFGEGGMPKMKMPQGKMPQGKMPEGKMPQGKMPQGKMPQSKGGGMMGMPAVGKEVLAKLHSPTIYIIGGETDIAYPQAIDDFARIDKVPVAIANLEGVGHGGTYSQPNGGEFGVVAGAWLKWQLKEDKEAGKMFTGSDCGLCTREGWTYEKKKIP
ncbi:MAG: alpha/beta hydrolase [Acidobacteriota bacterium]